MSRRKKITAEDVAAVQKKGGVVPPSTKAQQEKAARAAAPKKKGRPKKFPHPGVVLGPADAEDEKAMRARLADADESRAALRLKARIAYTTDVNQISVAQLAELPEFSAVGLAQLQKWCWADGWHDERLRFLADLQKRMELAISDEVTRQRLSYLRALKPVLESALNKFKPHAFVQNPLDPKDDRCTSCGRLRGYRHEDPFYGVDADKIVNSIVKLVEIDLSLSEVVARSVAGNATEEKKEDGRDGSPPLTGTVTNEEARLAAHAILRKRRAAIVVRGGDRNAVVDSDDGDGDDDAAEGDGADD